METTATKGRGEKGGKRQITVTIDRELLKRLDALTAKYDQKRSAVICMAVYQALEQGLILKEA